MHLVLSVYHEMAQASKFFPVVVFSVRTYTFYSMNIHHLFITDRFVAVGIFRYLMELDHEDGTHRNLQSLLSIVSILENRSHLTRVCRVWLQLLTQTHTLSLASLHSIAFGCHGAATELFTRCTILRDLYFAAWNFEASMCEHAIVEFLKLPWRVRVDRLHKYLQKTETYSQKRIRKEMVRAQNLFSPQTFARLERSIVEFSEGVNIPTDWRPASQRYSQPLHMQYELLNFKSGHPREVAPDEFIATFKDVKLYSSQIFHPEQKHYWVVKAVVQLSSVMCFPQHVNHKFKGACMFAFHSHSFEASMCVFLGSRLDLIFDFVTIPPSSLHCTSACYGGVALSD